MKLRELRKDEIALYRVDKENYIILRKMKTERIEEYIVQWWSERMKYYWSKYNLSYVNAIQRFVEKIRRNPIRDYELDP